MYSFHRSRSLGSTALLFLGMAASQATVCSAQTSAGRAMLLPAGTSLSVRLAQSIDTKRDRPGTPFVAHVTTAIVRNGTVIVPRGAECRGHLAESKPSGRLRGRATLRLALDSVIVNGRKYTIETTRPTFVSKDHKKRNLALIGGGAGTGAGIGAIAGGGVGALIGAGAGATAGTVGAVATGQRNVHLASETRLTFRLRGPVRVQI